MWRVPIVDASDGEALLRLWERGLGRTGAMRAGALLERPDEAAPPRTLGERNVRLLDLHARLFGTQTELYSHCPSCGAAAAFGIDCGALVARLSGRGTGPSHRTEIDGYAVEFRLPDGADLVDASVAATEDDFVARLLERCVRACIRDGAAVPVREVPEAVLDALSRQMESLDPAARVSFAVECPQCGAAWDAHLDVDQLVWTKIQAEAERLLLEIDALARAYGWTEREVLDLNPVRRAAYLQLVSG